MIESLVLLWLAAFVLMGSPGPATLSLAAVGAVFGYRAGLRYLAGIVTGTTGVLLMIATGVTGLIAAQPVLARALAAAAALYILYLAVKIAMAPPLQQAAGRDSPPFAAGFALAIANPKAFAAIAAVYAGQNLLPDTILFDAVAKITALFLVIVIVNGAWLVFGAAMSKLLHDPLTSRIANIAFAVMLVASVALTVMNW